MTYIDELASRGYLETARFAYDRDAASFLVNDQPLALDAIAASPVLLGDTVNESLTQVSPAELSSLNLTDFSLLSTPRFFDWLMTADGMRAVRGVPEVIHQVFNAVHDVKTPYRGRDSLHGFGAAYLREGHVIVNTIGSCACLGVKVDGHIVNYNEWESKYAEYEFHNLEKSFPAQTISLLAGLGHLAHLSDKSA